MAKKKAPVKKAPQEAPKKAPVKKKEPPKIVQLDLAELRALIAIVGKSVSTSDLNPVLTNIQVEVKRNKISFSGSDSTIYSKVTMPCLGDTEDVGSFCISGKRFSNLIAALPETGELSLSITPDTVTVAMGKMKARYKRLVTEGFPEIPKSSKKDLVIPVYGSTFKLFKRSTYSISRDLKSGALCNSLLHYNKGIITLTSTNGSVINQIVSEEDSSKEDKKLYIPFLLVDLLPLFDKVTQGDENVLITDSGHHITIFTKEVTLVVSKLNMPAFPDVDTLIVKATKGALTLDVDRCELLDILSRAATILTSEYIKETKLEFKKNSLSISTVTTGGEVDYVDTLKGTGKPVGIVTLNAEFVLPYLESSSAETISIGYKSATDVVSFIEDDQVYLVLPITS